MTKCVKETDIFLFDADLFKDDEEHYYDFWCYDGFAIGKRCDTDSHCEPKFIVQTYPLLAEVEKDYDLCAEVFENRGGVYGGEKLTYGDVMMYLGKTNLKSVPREAAIMLSKQVNGVSEEIARGYTDSELREVLALCGMKGRFAKP